MLSSVHGLIQYLPPALFRQLQLQVQEWREAEQTRPAIPHSGNGSAPPPFPTRIGHGGLEGDRPHPDTIHVWFDEAAKRDQGGSVRFVGFQVSGMILFAFGKAYEGLSDPFVMECLALRDALQWCLMHGFVFVKFHGDSQQLIHRMVRSDVSHDRSGAILEDARALASQFSWVSFCFVSRAHREFDDWSTPALFFLLFMTELLPLPLTKKKG
ncbi:unnamed protein product [Linum trigynum]|uniref:RNase H type-1 domain-containing protein n=1 Tax=Linum trigynum TaxID=586398 RepID=A0AAV2EWU4_9ROSI